MGCYVLHHAPSDQYVRTALVPPEFTRPVPGVKQSFSWAVQFDLVDSDSATWFVSRKKAELIRDWLCAMTDYDENHLVVKTWKA